MILVGCLADLSGIRYRLLTVSTSIVASDVHACIDDTCGMPVSFIAAETPPKGMDPSGNLSDRFEDRKSVV